MRFSKKLLAALLPIAATGAIIPVVTSCNKGNGWVIYYGDSINCLNETPSKDETPYHNINDVKNAVKNHTAIEPSKILTDYPSWDDDKNKQMMYFDLIASNSLINENKFELTWKVGTPYVITFKTKDVNANADSVNYVIGDKDEKMSEESQTLNYYYVNIKIDSYSVKSYNFQNTRVTAPK